jgi:hypothetical protein
MFYYRGVEWLALPNNIEAEPEDPVSRARIHVFLRIHLT